MKETRSSHLGEEKTPPKLGSFAFSFFSGEKKKQTQNLTGKKSFQNMLQMSGTSAELTNWKAQTTIG